MTLTYISTLCVTPQVGDPVGVDQLFKGQLIEIVLDHLEVIPGISRGIECERGVGGEKGRRPPHITGDNFIHEGLSQAS